MSIEINNSPKKNLKNNEEACVLREIYNIVDAKKENKEIEIENKNNFLNEKFNIKNIELSNLISVENKPKNRYKSKLQKLLFKKKM